MQITSALIFARQDDDSHHTQEMDDLLSDKYSTEDMKQFRHKTQALETSLRDSTTAGMLGERVLY
jgi:hypothetical protein